MSQDKPIEVVFTSRHGIYQAGEKAGFEKHVVEDLLKRKVAMLTRPVQERIMIQKNVETPPPLPFSAEESAIVDIEESDENQRKGKGKNSHRK